MYNIPTPYIRPLQADPNEPVQLLPGSQPSLATLKTQRNVQPQQIDPRALRRPLPAAATQAPAVAAAAPTVAPAVTAPEYTGTGIGVGAQGGEIFKRNADGVPEFTNVNATPGLAGAIGATGVAAPAPVAAPTSTTGYGGFAPGEARAYLDTMAGKDAAKAQATQARKADIAADVERIGLRNAMTSGTPQERRTARMQMEALDKRQNLATVEAGLGERTTQTLDTEMAKASLVGQLGLSAAQAKALGAMQAAQTTGQYGLESARTKALGQIGAAETALGSGSNLKAQQEALTQEFINSQLATAIANNDVDAIKFYSSGKYAPAAKPASDPVTGAPLSATAITMQQQLLEDQLRGRLAQ